MSPVSILTPSARVLQETGPTYVHGPAPALRTLNEPGSTYLRGAPQGLRGAPGPDPWLDPVQVIAANGPLTIDYALGKHVRLALNGNVALTIVNWPPINAIARLTLEIQNAAAFAITWPGAVVWPAGIEPTLTPSGTDVIILSTTTAGAVVFGFPAGLGFA